MRKTLILIGALVVLFAGPGSWFWLAPPHWFREAVVTEPAYRADRLFGSTDPNYSAETHKIAQRIEWGDALTPADLAPVLDRLDQRHGEDITLLLQAVASGNIEAVDALLAAGADPYQLDKSVGSTRNFAYLLTMPGGNLLDMAGINRMLESYLRHGGDPNATWGDKPQNQGNMTDELALSQNLDGLRMVLKVGGDPWKLTWNNGNPYGCAMENLAANHAYAMLDELIDAGYFDNLLQSQLDRFLASLGGYAQRDDETSREIQRIAKRVLKRNPHYVEPPADSETATRRIFKRHWQDPAPGEIPWDEIRSDAVK